MSKYFRAIAGVALFGAAAPAMAQTNVSFLNRYSWSENCGWMNWRSAGAPAGNQGVHLHSTFFSGFIWGENIGFINLGDGTPANGSAYANLSNADFGVNLSLVTGAVTGLGWGENVGWINFSAGALATPPRPARFDFGASRLRGFAWGENIGWINLDDANAFVEFPHCRGDFNRDGSLSSQDFFDFLTAFFGLFESANFNGDGAINSQDFFDFIGAFFAGC